MYMCLGQVMGVLHQPQRVNQPAGGWAGLDQGTLHKLCSLGMVGSQQYQLFIPCFGLWGGEDIVPSRPLLWWVDVIIMASLVDLKLNPCAPHLDCIAWLWLWLSVQPCCGSSQLVLCDMLVRAHIPVATK